MKNNLIGVGRHIYGIYAVDFKKVGEQQTYSSPNNGISIFDFWHERLAHAHSRAIKGRADKDAVRDMNRRYGSILDACVGCIERGMMNKPMPSRNLAEARLRAVINTDGARP